MRRAASHTACTILSLVGDGRPTASWKAATAAEASRTTEKVLAAASTSVRYSATMSGCAGTLRSPTSSQNAQKRRQE